VLFCFGWLVFCVDLAGASALKLCDILRQKYFPWGERCRTFGFPISRFSSLIVLRSVVFQWMFCSKCEMAK
jgi:hypothetical protein